MRAPGSSTVAKMNRIFFLRRKCSTGSKTTDEKAAEVNLYLVIVGSVSLGKFHSWKLYVRSLMFESATSHRRRSSIYLAQQGGMANSSKVQSNMGPCPRAYSFDCRCNEQYVR